MARLVCAVLLLAVASAAAAATDDSRIIGGFPSSIYWYPYKLQVQRPWLGIWSQHCGGIVLTAGYILSTCSCFVGPNSMLNRRRILAGTSERNGYGQVSELARVVKHPYWNEGLDRDNDIAVIQLQTPLQYTSSVQQATILGQGAFVPDNMPARQVGWGVTFNEEFPSIFSSFIKELDVVTVNNQRCALNYRTLSNIPMTVTPNMICAGAIGYSGACLGDRGSPLVVNDISVGLVSWGRGCTNETFPTVHTAISSYTNWIVDNVW